MSARPHGSKDNTMGMTDDVSAKFFASPFAKLAEADLTEQLLEMGREAAKLWLDGYEQALGSIASAHEQAAGQTNVDWLAEAARTHAKALRDIATRQVALGRELLD
jgi:hypothetical protein